MSMKKRSDRYKQPKDESNSFDRLFYWLIAGLFVVLIAIIIFIFVSGGDSVDQVSDDLVQQTAGESDEADKDNSKDKTADKDKKDKKDKKDEDKVDESDTASKQQQSQEQETSNQQTQAELNQANQAQQNQQHEGSHHNQTTTNGDTSIVNEAPPHDTNHYTDFSDGSSDRLEIRDKVSTVTGISESDMIERWIGNDGIARVEATVESRSTGAKYIVYLQYGNGQWHVESVHNN
ncbi:YrrS family protein [Dolosigranulum savutiense]|uniref:YrrS family protein n=1 Tax=Dolosigranulum savutiense TaxID=3110288 RepID=A0AB74U7I7_9LACT